MTNPAFTFWNKRTYENFSIQNRGLPEMMYDIANWEIENMTRVVDQSIRSQYLTPDVQTRAYVFLNPDWQIIYHRGVYEPHNFIETK